MSGRVESAARSATLDEAAEQLRSALRLGAVLVVALDDDDDSIRVGMTIGVEASRAATEGAGHLLEMLLGALEPALYDPGDAS